MAPREVLEATTRRLIAAYETYTLEAFMSVRSDDCTNHFLPASLGMPAMDNEQYCELFRPLMDIMRNFRLQVLSLATDTERNKVTLHATSTAESDLGPYHGEYILILTMTPDGQKVCKFEEFVDAGLVQKYTAPLRVYAMKRDKAMRAKGKL